MSGQRNLQRSSWKAEAIRKGNLKISGPFPIMEDTPLNEAEEKEFEETGALQSPSQPQDELEQLHSRPQTPPQPQHAPPNVPLEPASLTSHPIDEQVQRHVQEQQPSRSPPRSRQVEEIARESVIEPRPHTPTPFRSTPESTTKSSQKKKRKSGLRNVFRKMFGRKDKGSIEEEAEPRRGHSYHHSDPGLLNQSPPRELRTANGPRISDLPVKELQPLHPLGQHLPFPMNVNAPQASPPNEYLTFDMQKGEMGRRRATLPSVPSAGAQRHSFDEPHGRLSEWEERPDESPMPSPGIGIALSSPTHATTPMRNKRRSRSADALIELVKDRSSVDRRRSAEIRYWRQSFTSGSVYSRPQTARTVETIRSVQLLEPIITEPEAEVVEMSATLAHADEPSPLPTEHDEDREVHAPVSAFNFGLKSGFSDDTSEPPVPASPPERNKNRVSIEDRVTNLEGTFQSIEASLRRISSRSNRQTIILSDAPRNLRSRNRSSSAAPTHFDDLPTYQSSTDTLKSNPASPTFARPGSRDTEDSVLEKLYEALRYERTARKALEQQVQGLQHDIADLHALVSKLIVSATATSPSYPTPSPDMLVVSSTEDRMGTPRADKSRFARDDDDDEDMWDRVVPLPSPREVWATPKEEGFGGSAAGSGFFRERV